MWRGAGSVENIFVRGWRDRATARGAWSLGSRKIQVRASPTALRELLHPDFQAPSLWLKLPSLWPSVTAAPVTQGGPQVDLLLCCPECPGTSAHRVQSKAACLSLGLSPEHVTAQYIQQENRGPCCSAQNIPGIPTLPRLQHLCKGQHRAPAWAWTVPSSQRSEQPASLQSQ